MDTAIREDRSGTDTIVSLSLLVSQKRVVREMETFRRMRGYVQEKEIGNVR